MIYIQLAAKNDNNGNPRRVFVLFNEEGNIEEVRDEGYQGDPYASLKNVYFGGRFETTPSERRFLLKEFGELKSSRFTTDKETADEAALRG